MKIESAKEIIASSDKSVILVSPKSDGNQAATVLQSANQSSNKNLKVMPILKSLSAQFDVNSPSASVKQYSRFVFFAF